MYINAQHLIVLTYYIGQNLLHSNDVAKSSIQLEEYYMFYQRYSHIATLLPALKMKESKIFWHFNQNDSLSFLRLFAWYNILYSGFILYFAQFSRLMPNLKTSIYFLVVIFT